MPSLQHGQRENTHLEQETRPASFFGRVRGYLVAPFSWLMGANEQRDANDYEERDSAGQQSPATPSEPAEEEEVITPVSVASASVQPISARPLLPRTRPLITRTYASANLQPSASIRTQPLAFITVQHPTSTSARPSASTSAQPLASTRIQPFASTSAEFFPSTGIQPLAFAHPRSFKSIRAQASASTGTQPSASLSTQPLASTGTRPSAFTRAQSSASTGTQPFASASVQPPTSASAQPVASTSVQPVASIRTQPIASTTAQPVASTRTQPFAPVQPPASTRTQPSASTSAQPFASASAQPPVSTSAQSVASTSAQPSASASAYEGNGLGKRKRTATVLADIEEEREGEEDIQYLRRLSPEFKRHRHESPVDIVRTFDGGETVSKSQSSFGSSESLSTESVQLVESVTPAPSVTSVALATPVQPPASTRTQPVASTSAQPVASTSVQPVASTSVQPVASIRIQPSASTSVQPPAFTSARPLASTSAQPVASTSTQPLASTSAYEGNGLRKRKLTAMVSTEIEEEGEGQEEIQYLRRLSPEFKRHRYEPGPVGENGLESTSEALEEPAQSVSWPGPESVAIHRPTDRYSVQLVESVTSAPSVVSVTPAPSVVSVTPTPSATPTPSVKSVTPAPSVKSVAPAPSVKSVAPATSTRPKILTPQFGKPEINRLYLQCMAPPKNPDWIDMISMDFLQSHPAFVEPLPDRHGIPVWETLGKNPSVAELLASKQGKEWCEYLQRVFQGHIEQKNKLLQQKKVLETQAKAKARKDFQLHLQKPELKRLLCVTNLYSHLEGYKPSLLWRGMADSAKEMTDSAVVS